MTQRKLLLIRHAKSDWATGQADHARPLNKRGRRDAPRIGAWIKSQGLTPATILCSDAERTRETCALMALDAPVRYVNALYHAEPHTMLALIDRTDGDLALIGHNPGMTDLIHQLTDSPPDHPRFHDIPTATVAAFTLTHRAQLTHFVTPHDLP